MEEVMTVEEQNYLRLLADVQRADSELEEADARLVKFREENSGWRLPNFANVKYQMTGAQMDAERQALFLLESERTKIIEKRNALLKEFSEAKFRLQGAKNV